MQISRLEGFYWVVKTAGYASAARAFPYPITQPGVFQQVKRLEADLGVALIERAHKEHLILTAAGNALYTFIRPWFDELPAIVSAITEGRHGGRLRIHAAGQVLRQLLPQWLLRLRRHRPDIEIDLIEVGNAEIEQLRRGACDLVVDYLPNIPADIQTMRVGVVRPFIVVPAGHDAARRHRLRLADLRGETFVAYDTERRHRGLQIRALADAGVEPPRVISASSSETILALVEAGLGFSIVPSFATHGPRHRGVVARRITPRVEFPIYAAWRLVDPPNPLIAALAECAPKGT